MKLLGPLKRLTVTRWTDMLLIAAVVVLATQLHSTADDTKKSEFARGTIDLGIVVTDVDKSVKFYTEAIGFKESKPFTVDAPFCGDAGLTDNKALNIRVLVLDDGVTATKLKLMALPGVKTRINDNQFVHSELGFRYLTIYVADGNATAERLKRAGVKPIAKGPVPIPPSIAPGLALSVVRDPDGNLIELIGPVRQ